MEHGAKAAPGPRDDPRRDTEASRLRDLMDPAALEARLEVARAKRAEVLARKRMTGAPERRAGAKPSVPPDVPPECFLPLHTIDPRPEETSSARVVPDAGRSEQDSEQSDVEQPELRAVVPVAGPVGRHSPAPPRMQEASLRPVSSLYDVEVVEAPRLEGDLSGSPASAKASRAAWWPFAAAALMAGVVLGLGLPAVIPQLEGWRIVIVRSPAEPDISATGNDEESGRIDDVSRVDTAPAPPAEDVSQTPAEIETVSVEGAIGTQSAGDPAYDPPDLGNFLSVSPRPVETARSESADSLVAEFERAAPSVPRMPTIAPDPPSEPAAGTMPMGMPEVAPATPLPPAAAAPALRAGLAADLDPAVTPLGLDAPSLGSGPGEAAFATLAPLDVAAPTPGSGNEDRGLLAAVDAYVILNHPPNASAPAKSAVTALAAAGLGDVSAHEVAISISAPNVRFFHEADRDIAGEIAAVLSDALAGADVAARDFTDFRPKPDEGLIEVWLAGNAPAPVASGSRTRAPAPIAARPSPDGLRDALRQRLVRTLEERLRQKLQ